jgi:TrmH family RNA methyltransferase
VVNAEFGEFVDWANRSGYHVYGTSAAAGRVYREVAVYRRPLILLMGSERQGLTEAQAAVCEELVRLPMRGEVTSLNLAVATGILLYAVLDSLD